MGLGNAILAGMGILPPGASATPGKVANGAIESGGNGGGPVHISVMPPVSSVLAAMAAPSATELIDLTSASTGIVPSEASAAQSTEMNTVKSNGNGFGSMQNFPTTTLVVSAVAPIAVAAPSATELIDLISASTGIVPSGASATLGKAVNGVIESGGNGGGPVYTPSPTAATSATELIDLISASTGIVPSGASATLGKAVNGATESGSNTAGPVQSFRTTTLVIPLVPAAATNTTGLIHPISAGTGILPSKASATPGKPANGGIQSGGNGGGGGGGGNGNGSATGSVVGQTSVPTVSTGGAEGVNGWENWWLGFGILVCGVGMVYWV